MLPNLVFLKKTIQKIFKKFLEDANFFNYSQTAFSNINSRPAYVPIQNNMVIQNNVTFACFSKPNLQNCKKITGNSRYLVKLFSGSKLG